VNPLIADRSTQHILASAQRLAAQPMIGQRLPGFKERDVCRLLIDDYELRYELRGADIYVLRIFHTREDR
jgi:plasmid stabilization system protein ParE